MESSLLNSLDMSLDDLISKKKQSQLNSKKPAKNDGSNEKGSGPVRRKGRGRRSRAAATPYSAGRNNDTMDVDDANKSGKNRSRNARNGNNRGSKGSIFSRLGGNKPALASDSTVIVKNLKYDVTEEDLKELFGAIGKMKHTEIIYDRTDRSTGVGKVVYVRRIDAEKAVKQYNGRTLDDRVMKLELEGASDTSARMENAPGSKANSNSKKSLFGTALDATRDNDDGGNRRNKGRSGGRGGRGRRNKEKTTAGNLDDEMDNYMNDN